jgi:hypothetical protein
MYVYARLCARRIYSVPARPPSLCRCARRRRLSSRVLTTLNFHSAPQPPPSLSPTKALLVIALCGRGANTSAREYCEPHRFAEHARRIFFLSPCLIIHQHHYLKKWWKYDCSLTKRLDKIAQLEISLLKTK